MSVQERAPDKQQTEKPSPRRGRVWLLAVLVAALAGTGGYFLGHRTQKPPSQPKHAAPPPAPAGPPTLTLDPQQMQYAQISVSPAQQVTLPVRLTTTGTVAANLNGQADVMSHLAGRVVTVSANVGQYVTAGQVVAVLSSPDLFNAQAAYRDAVLRSAAASAALRREAGLAGLGQFSRPALEQAQQAFAQVQGEVQTDKDAVNVAQNQAAQAQSQAALTQTELTRDQALYAHGLVSGQDLDQATARAQQAARALIAAQDAARQAVDQQVNAQKRLRVAGRVLARQKALARSGLLNAEQVGPYRAAAVQAAHEVEATAANVRLLGGVPMDEASPQGGLLAVTAPISGTVGTRTAMLGQNVQPGDSLLTIYNLRTVVVQLTVYQEDLANVQVGQTVTVSGNTAPGRTFLGKVAVIGAVVDPQTRTVPVSCVIQNPQETLRPGVYVTGSIYGAARRDVVAVPDAAVQNFNGGSIVFTPTGKPGEFAATPVQTGAEADGMTEITSGLTPGQSYVSKNAFVLKSQMIKDTLD